MLTLCHVAPRWRTRSPTSSRTWRRRTGGENRSFGGITAFWVSLGFQDAHPLPCRPQVAYEEPDFIKDVAEKDWGWTYEAAIWTEPADVAAENKIASKFVPQTRAFVVSNDGAVVLIFRGARAWRPPTCAFMLLGSWQAGGRALWEACSLLCTRYI